VDPPRILRARRGRPGPAAQAPSPTLRHASARNVARRWLLGRRGEPGRRGSRVPQWSAPRSTPGPGKLNQGLSGGRLAAGLPNVLPLVLKADRRGVDDCPTPQGRPTNSSDLVADRGPKAVPRGRARTTDTAGLLLAHQKTASSPSGCSHPSYEVGNKGRNVAEVSGRCLPAEEPRQHCSPAWSSTTGPRVTGPAVKLVGEGRTGQVRSWSL